MALPARRQLHHAPHPLTRRELAHGRPQRRRHPRVRHNLQGLPPRGHPEYPPLRRDASFHPRPRLLVRSQHLRDSHLQSCPRVWREPLRYLPHLPRLLRSVDHSLPAAIHDAAAPLLRHNWSIWHGSRLRNVRVASDSQNRYWPAHYEPPRPALRHCRRPHPRRNPDDGYRSARRTPGTALSHSRPPRTLRSRPNPSLALRREPDPGTKQTAAPSYFFGASASVSFSLLSSSCASLFESLNAEASRSLASLSCSTNGSVSVSRFPSNC